MIDDQDLKIRKSKAYAIRLCGGKALQLEHVVIFHESGPPWKETRKTGTDIFYHGDFVITSRNIPDPPFFFG